MDMMLSIAHRGIDPIKWWFSLPRWSSIPLTTHLVSVRPFFSLSERQKGWAWTAVHLGRRVFFAQMIISYLSCPGKRQLQLAASFSFPQLSPRPLLHLQQEFIIDAMADAFNKWNHADFVPPLPARCCLRRTPTTYTSIKWGGEASWWCMWLQQGAGGAFTSWN